jgi:hypothetical protein
VGQDCLSVLRLIEDDEAEAFVDARVCVAAGQIDRFERPEDGEILE